MKDFFLEANPNPERIGCPDEETIRALGEDRLPANHPARLHIGTCSECFAEFRGYQGEWKEKQIKRRRFIGWAVAASLGIAVGGGTWAVEHEHHKTETMAQLAQSSVPVPAQVDLFEAATLRGAGGDDDETPELQAVSLPPSVVKLDVTLPRFSQTGGYEIRVSKDKAGREMVADGQGVAVPVDGKVHVNVTLDLRSARTGAYFLATVRGSDNGLYFYPLKIR